MDYIKVGFSDVDQQTADMLVAGLSELDYEGFEEGDQTLNAYIPVSLFNVESLADLASNNNVAYTITELPSTNWNAVWESNFQPVVVDDFCTVRAGFHPSASNTVHEIVITPKMSFGTGHHATTFMMIQQMGTIDMEGKKVLDFGTGTGVLAILAAKLGAGKTTAVDNDEWSIDNAGENFSENNVDIDLLKGDRPPADQQYDIILANITRNVIMDNFLLLKEGLMENGVLLLSGLLKEDEPVITAEAERLGFVLENKIQRDNWISIKYKILFG